MPQGSILGPILFLIFFNDFETVLTKARVIEFADDTVIYVAHHSVAEIEKSLNHELQNISTYFRLNDLVANVRKGKTEVMLFGTRQRLLKAEKGITVTFNHAEVNVTETYKYLGTTIDQSLSMSINFEQMYKKVCSRLRLLNSLRSNFHDETALVIFRSMVLPLITFNCSVNVNLNRTQLDKLSSIDRRMTQIIR